MAGAFSSVVGAVPKASTGIGSHALSVATHFRRVPPCTLVTMNPCDRPPRICDGMSSTVDPLEASSITVRGPPTTTVKFAGVLSSPASPVATAKTSWTPLASRGDWNDHIPVWASACARPATTPSMVTFTCTPSGAVPLKRGSLSVVRPSPFAPVSDASPSASVGAAGGVAWSVMNRGEESSPAFSEASTGVTAIVWTPAVSGASAGTVYVHTPFSTGTSSPSCPLIEIRTWLAAPSTLPRRVGVRSYVTPSIAEDPVSLKEARPGDCANRPKTCRR